MSSPLFIEDQTLDVLSRASKTLGHLQNADGHWVFDLEADATITAEYVLLEHFMGRVSPDRQEKMARHLRRRQIPEGGWPLFEGGTSDLSASVKAYWALKLAGDRTDSPHMLRAREAILAQGGAACTNVFTRVQLALFGLVPWRAVPAMPVEIVLLPRRALFSIWSVSYWSRTCMVPLLVIQALRPAAKNPQRVRLDELFVEPVERVGRWSNGSSRGLRGGFFALFDGLLRRADPLHSRRLRAKAVAAATAYVEERLNGDDGPGAIYPAMAYSLMMFDALGRFAGDPVVTTLWKALDGLVIEDQAEAFCQPCRSPVWDTALAAHALLETYGPDCDGANAKRIDAACDWLAARQITDVRGDWVAAAKADTEPGGWAFQYRNDHFPDVDDTSLVAMLLLRNGRSEHLKAIERARQWILGMQSDNGGWGAFDVDNDRFALNDIPFADHGALLDPPTADVTARCISFLGQLGRIEDRPAINKAVAFLLRGQENDGSWFGRWEAAVHGSSDASSVSDAIAKSRSETQTTSRTRTVYLCIPFDRHRTLDVHGGKQSCVATAATRPQPGRTPSPTLSKPISPNANAAAPRAWPKTSLPPARGSCRRSDRWKSLSLRLSAFASGMVPSSRLPG